MKSILRATAIFGTSSLVAIAVGLISSKAYALLIGPTGLGFMGLLQSLVGLTGLAAGMGIGVGLVRFIASELAQENALKVAALRRAAWLLYTGLTGLAVVLLVFFRSQLSHLILGGSEHSTSVIFMGLALIFSTASGIQTSILNAHHYVGALAKLAILNTIISATFSIASVWLWRERGIVPAIIMGSFGGLVVSSYYVQRLTRQASVHPARHEVLRACKSLVRFGVPYTASILVGTGVQLMLPVMVLHVLDVESVGFYKAAVALSVTYLGFLLSAMAQDYYPRVSAVRDQPAALINIVNEQHRLVMLLAAPIILGTLALVPFLVPLIYSPQFYPAVEILEWQLIGDLFRFSSWTMGFVILARSNSSIYFLTELIAGLATLSSAWAAMKWYGLPGLGMSFLFTYVVYYLVAWLTVRREIRMVLTAENRSLLLLAVTAALVVRLLPLIGFESLRTPIALSLAFLAGLASLRLISQHVRAVRNAGAG